jgi:hypothetical protein
MVRVHLSSRELTTLYATLKSRDGTRGLTAITRKLFRKDPSELTTDEAATVVIAMVNPRIFKFPELEARRRAELHAASQRIPALMNDCTN